MSQGIQDRLWRSVSRAPSSVCHTLSPSAGYSVVTFFWRGEGGLKLQIFIVSHSRNSRWQQGHAPSEACRGSFFGSPYLLGVAILGSRRSLTCSCIAPLLLCPHVAFSPYVCPHMAIFLYGHQAYWIRGPPYLTEVNSIGSDPI